jgi:hypothetical protein
MTVFAITWGNTNLILMEKENLYKGKIRETGKGRGKRVTEGNREGG